MSSNGYQRTTHGPEILLKKRWPFKRNFLLDTDLEVSMHLDLDVLDDNHQRTITIIEQIITPQASAIKAQLSPDKTYFVNSDNANSHFFGKDLTPSDLARYSLYNEKTCIWDSNPRQPESQSGALPTELRSPQCLSHAWQDSNLQPSA